MFDLYMQNDLKMKERIHKRIRIDVTRKIVAYRRRNILLKEDINNSVESSIIDITMDTMLATNLFGISIFAFIRIIQGSKIAMIFFIFA